MEKRFQVWNGNTHIANLVPRRDTFDFRYTEEALSRQITCGRTHVLNFIKAAVYLSKEPAAVSCRMDSGHIVAKL